MQLLQTRIDLGAKTPLYETWAVCLGGLGDLGLGGGPSQPPQARQQSSFQDPFGAPAPSPASAPAQQDLPVLLSADKAKGLTLRGQLARMDGRIGQSFLFLPCGSICELSSTYACARKMDHPCFCLPCQQASMLVWCAA